LILRKRIKTDATRCYILKIKCTKFDFGCDSAPDPPGGACSAPPDPLAGFKAAHFGGYGYNESGESTKPMEEVPLIGPD